MRWYAGLGFLGLLLPAAVGALLGGITGVPALLGVGVIVGAAAAYALGIHLNRTRPARRLAAQMDARAAQLRVRAATGTFTRGPGYLPPSSPRLAHQQADDQALEEYAAIKNTFRTRHVLLKLPLQHWGFICAVIGVVLIIVHH